MYHSSGAMTTFCIALTFSRDIVKSLSEGALASVSPGRLYLPSPPLIPLAWSTVEPDLPRLDVIRRHRRVRIDFSPGRFSRAGDALVYTVKATGYDDLIADELTDDIPDTEDPPIPVRPVPSVFLGIIENETVKITSCPPLAISTEAVWMSVIRFSFPSTRWWERINWRESYRRRLTTRQR